MHTPYVFHGYLKDDYLLIIESSSICRTVQILHHHIFTVFSSILLGLSLFPNVHFSLFPLEKNVMPARYIFVWFYLFQDRGSQFKFCALKKKIVRHFAEKPNLLKIVLYFINQWNYYAIMIEISEYQTKLLCKSYSEKKMTGFSAIVILF